MLNKFLDYVEIRTKITSIFTFLMTIAYILYLNQPINWMLTSIFFVSMFVFDLTTTAINNYIDTKTNHQILQFKRSTALKIIYVLFGISALLGLYLAFLTDVIIFFIGGLCFLCGIFYTFGPIPISRLPLGEFFSGLFYGLMIPFIILYINLEKGTFISLNLSFETIVLSFKVIPILKLLMFSIIPFCVTANIMLANNICDLEKDIKVKRYTLPYYIGNKSLFLFAALYYTCYVSVTIMVIFKILHPICLLIILTLIIVQKNINEFLKLQNKQKTFITAIKNYVVIMGTFTALIYMSSLIS